MLFKFMFQTVANDFKIRFLKIHSRKCLFEKFGKKYRKQLNRTFSTFKNYFEFGSTTTRCK
jgi:hypothetical protein